MSKAYIFNAFKSNEIVKIWTSIVDGEIHAQNGNDIRKDYYDSDIIENVLWSQSPVPQPNELGVGCHYLHYESRDHPYNGIGDVPCKAYTETTCYASTSVCDGCALEYGPCWRHFICLVPK